MIGSSDPSIWHATAFSLFASGARARSQGLWRGALARSSGDELWRGALARIPGEELAPALWAKHRSGPGLCLDLDPSRAQPSCCSPALVQSGSRISLDTRIA